MCSVCLSYVVVMPNKRQALVEYEDMNGSSTAVTYAADNQVYIAGHPAFINYSTSQKISRPGDSDDSRTVNNVLLFTIMNPIYPITTVSAKICVITLPGTVLCTSWRVSLNVSAVVLTQTVVSSYALQEKFYKLAAALVVWNNVSYVSVAEIKGKQRPQMLQPIQIQSIFAICWNVLLFSENWVVVLWCNGRKTSLLRSFMDTIQPQACTSL